MAPAFVLVAGWVLLRVAGKLGVERVATWRAAGRGASAGMFVFTGATHFSSMKDDYAAMIPEPLPRSLRLIYLTGVLQIACALGLLTPRLRRWAGIGLVSQLLVLFPANVYAAREGIPFRGEPPTPLRMRAPLQLLFLAVVWWTAIAEATTNGEVRGR